MEKKNIAGFQSMTTHKKKLSVFLKKDKKTIFLFIITQYIFVFHIQLILYLFFNILCFTLRSEIFYFSKSVLFFNGDHFDLQEQDKRLYTLVNVVLPICLGPIKVTTAFKMSLSSNESFMRIYKVQKFRQVFCHKAADSRYYVKAELTFEPYIKEAINISMKNLSKSPFFLSDTLKK